MHDSPVTNCPRASPLPLACLSPEDDGYPVLLRAIHDPPRRLWVRGALGEGPCVAIVGARACSAYGRTVAEDLAAALAARGIVVVSGLARGIDAAAHRGALRAGSTVAVLPNGIHRIYPVSHRNLAAAVARAGAVVAEFDNAEPPAPWHFPRRNRIIAGLSHCTVVVEAGERSGARITADLALDYDRDVLVVPGNITSPVSRGCNALLAEGARPCIGPDDVLAALPDGVRAALRPPDAAEPAHVAGVAARVLRRCRELGPVTLGTLASGLGLPLPELLATVSDLEADGHLSVRGGGLVDAGQGPILPPERRGGGWGDLP